MFSRNWLHELTVEVALARDPGFAESLTKASPLTQWRGWLQDMERSNRQTAPLSLRSTCAVRTSF